MLSDRKSAPGHGGPVLLQSKPEHRIRDFEEFPAAQDRTRWMGGVLRFGPFEVNFERQELRKHGLRLKLEDKPFEILEELLREPGKLVSRDELCAKLWPDTFVSYEHCLNTAVNKLRSALGDTSISFRFVETIRRRGYRFVGALQDARPAPPSAPRWVLLVLPLRLTGSQRALESFADGLTEELSAELARIDPARLGVIAVTTARRYKNAECTIADIGQKAGADLVLEGGARRAGDRLRISVELVRSRGQLCLWSEIYEGTLADPFACQAEIAGAVAAAIAKELDLRAAGTPLQRFRGPIAVSSELARKLS